MQIEFEMTGSILIACITGELDHHGAAAVRSEIDGTFIAFKARHLIMDFSGVTFADSSGIGVVMGRYNKVSEKGGEMAICGCSSYMREILFMAGIFTIIKETHNVEEAIDMIKRENPEIEDDEDNYIEKKKTEDGGVGIDKHRSK